MKRIPVLPTAIVALAVAAMIALGLWQLLDRLPRKEAYLAQLAGNPAKPAIAFPRFPDDTLLFRRASGFCLQVVAQKLVGAGAAGYRVIVSCRTGAEGPGMAVQLGTTRDPKMKVAYTGGKVAGYISHAPDSQSLIASLFDDHPKELMLVVATPPAGLTANGAPDLSAIPNNHLAYAWQWFFFAVIAAVIYVLALRRRTGARDKG